MHLFHRFLIPILLMSSMPQFSVRAVELPDAVLPHGWGVQLKGHCNDPETLDRVVELGLTWVRHGFHWAAIEKEKGVYDFGDYERFVKDCQARGLKIVGVIALQNKALYPHPKDEPGTSAYARYAAVLAEHFKDYDIVWELWNEPNTMTFWGKHGKKGNSEQYAEEYLRMVRATVPAMKKANPDCKILAGSVSNMWEKSYEWMAYCFNKGMMNIGFDGWSVHPYGVKAPEDYIEAYGTTRKLMADAGADPDFPMYNTERGFPLGKKEGYAGGKEELAKEYQAWHAVRQYLIDRYLGVNMTLWYEWDNKDKHKGFSLFSPSETLPVYTAVDTLLDQLSGFTLDGRIDLGADRDFALSFNHPDGRKTLVAWTAPPPMTSPDEIVDHAVTIPVPAAGRIQTVSLYGEPGVLPVEDGKITVELTGAPAYLILK